MQIFEGDILLFQTPDGGNISYIDGQPEMTGGFASAAFLSLFGGNERDDGTDGNQFSWWGNLLENDRDYKYISETQNLLLGLPITAQSLRRIEQAAERDLEWFLNKNIANSVSVTLSMPDINSINFDITVKAEGREESFSFVLNWRAMQAESLQV